MVLSCLHSFSEEEAYEFLKVSVHSFRRGLISGGWVPGFGGEILGPPARFGGDAARVGARFGGDALLDEERDP